jgi:hypothetical protein
MEASERRISTANSSKIVEAPQFDSLSALPVPLVSAPQLEEIFAVISVIARHLGSGTSS